MRRLLFIAILAFMFVGSYLDAQEQSPIPPAPSIDQAGLFTIMGQMSVKVEIQARYIEDLKLKIIEQAKEIEELKKAVAAQADKSRPIKP